ncbi:MAG: hypothetical protein EPO32_09815 [Anaerolineae bacterium]|nr:MAG: hypothetical protein EPO32_09815 [Anaerolineae bacterium]
MAANQRTIRTDYRQYCSHAGDEVRIETEFATPAEFLPETPPRIVHRSCSHYCVCNLHDKAACSFAVTLPQVILLPAQFV